MSDKKIIKSEEREKEIEKKSNKSDESDERYSIIFINRKY
jgi:hypothetical protein